MKSCYRKAAEADRCEKILSTLVASALMLGVVANAAEIVQLGECHILSNEVDASAITNVFTGKVYKIKTVCIMAIDNNGYIYLKIPTLKNNEFSEKYYKASLKQAASVSVFYNGNKIAFDQVPEIMDGRTLVPVRFVSDCFDVNVEWDEQMKKVILTSK